MSNFWDDFLQKNYICLFTFSILKNCIYRIENWENIHNVNANDVKNGGDINKPAQAIIYQVLLFEDADSRFL